MNRGSTGAAVTPASISDRSPGPGSKLPSRLQNTNAIWGGVLTDVSLGGTKRIKKIKNGNFLPAAPMVPRAKKGGRARAQGKGKDFGKRTCGLEK